MFEFVGGNLSLDFANTVGGLRGQQEQELLHSYADVVRWSVAAHVLSELQAQELMTAAHRAPEAADTVLQRALQVREAIYALFAAENPGEVPLTEALHVLNQEVQCALAHAQILTGEAGFMWDWNDQAQGLGQLLGPIARAAAELLVAEERHLIRTCASDTCGWLFVDRTKNHRRRWCTTNGCGNRARVRQHRLRVRT